MELVDNETFLSRLTELFSSSKDKGTIWLTHKRFSYDDGTAMAVDSSEVREYPCLLRATDGGKNEFSTRVEGGQVEKFHAAYGALLKTSMMTALRKRDKKRDKTRSEQAARRKKKMTEPIVVDGPKRGNGRRKRQRQIKFALKQQESQQKFKEREETRLKTKSS